LANKLLTFYICLIIKEIPLFDIFDIALFTHTPTPSNTLPAQHLQHPVLSECCAMAGDISPGGFRGLSEAPGCTGQGTLQPLHKAFVPTRQE
jgi:hypothetical protein